MTKQNVLIVGGTGLIGSQVIEQFPDHADNKQLTYLGRQGFHGLPGHLEQNISPTENWAEAVAELKPDIVISCLGTTIKAAGSQEAFAAIDRDLVSVVAKAAKAAGAKQFIAVSSTMADSSASNFYLKTKGQAEDAIRAEGFDRVDIIRPGLLRGSRKEFRLGESIGIIASPVMDILLQGTLRRYRSIAAKDVAAAILSLTSEDGQGAFVHENDAILGKI